MLRDRGEWRRKHDFPRGPAYIPAGQAVRVLPETLTDLVALVRDAERTPFVRTALPEAPRVRAAGSGWSLSGVVVPPDYTGFIVRTDLLADTLYDVVPECLSAGMLAALREQPDPGMGVLDTTSFNLYHVEAGIKLNRLYSRLDRRPHPDDASWADFPTDRSPLTAGVELLRRCWALPTLGGAGGQSIAGAFSTSTHGGDIGMPPIADAVAAMHIVGCEGRQYWLEPSVPKAGAPPLTDDAKMRERFPGVTVIRDDTLFNAALVGAGRMGIIYSVVLRVVRQYGLAETRRHRAWEGDVEELVRGLDLTAEPFDHRFVQIVLNPHAGLGGSHSAWVTTHDATALADGDDTAGRIQRSGANAGTQPALGTDALMALLCSAADAGEVLGPALAFLAGAALTAGALGDLIFPGLGELIAGPILALDGALAALTAPARSGSLGDLVSDACNAVVGAVGAITDAEPLIGLINEGFLGLGQGDEGVPPDAPLTDVGYAILDRWNYRDRNCENSADSIEVAFPASSPNLLAWIDRMFTAARDLTHGTLVRSDGGVIPGPLAFAGYASLRFTGPTRATIGIERWEPTCIVEVAGLKALDGIEPFLDRIEANAKELGATVHWGQRNSLTFDEVEHMYPRLEQWRNGLARLSRNGLEQTFSTSHTQQRGLEVVQPRFAAFSVSPAFICLGEQIHVDWDAAENPPGTAITLEIQTPSLATEGLEVGLSGEHGLELEHGTSLVWATAQTPLPDGSGRHRIAATPQFEVRTFQTGDRYRLNGPAERRELDGEERWALEVTLDAGEWSPTLHAGDLYLASDSSTLTVRREGYEDALLRPGVGVELLPGPTPPLAGTWLLFSPAATGTAPTLAIEIEIRCR